MDQENQISLLMSENSLSELDKKEISRKINNLLNFINSLSEIKNDDHSLTIEINNISNLLQKELKATSKMIVKKNNSLSKELIKSLTNQKENSLQEIEVNQLRLEAELKKLKSGITYPTVASKSSIFKKIFNFFKLPRNSNNNELKGQITLTTNELNNLEKQRQELSNKIGKTGNEALEYINKKTYNSFLPTEKVSKANIENIRNKISFLN